MRWLLGIKQGRLERKFPWIDQLVDSTVGYELLSFMDVYSGYNQIPMHVLVQENTNFITDQGLYHYVVIPFELNNAEAAHLRTVNRVFKD